MYKNDPEADDPRFIIERIDGELEDVGAESVAFEYGHIVFSDETGAFVYAINSNLVRRITL